MRGIFRIVLVALALVAGPTAHCALPFGAALPAWVTSGAALPDKYSTAPWLVDSSGMGLAVVDFFRARDRILFSATGNAPRADAQAPRFTGNSVFYTGSSDAAPVLNTPASQHFLSLELSFHSTAR